MRRLANYYVQKKSLVDGFAKRKEFLCSGSYLFDESMTYIHLDNREISKKSEELFSQELKVINFSNGSFFLKSAVTKILRCYFDKKLVNNGATKAAFKGTVFLPDSNGKGVKIFDFEQREVLIAFGEKEIYQQKLDTYSQFRSWFPIPPIIDKNETKRIIIERYIEYKKSEDWDDYDANFIVNEVFRRYLEYFRKLTRRSIDWVPANEILKLLHAHSGFIEEVEQGISRELAQLPLPMLPVHGNLLSANILIDKKDSKNIWFTDWEMAGDMYFFYDFYFFMWNEAIINKNYSFIRYYMEGDYDAYFQHAFELFDLEFDNSRKREYLNIFFLNMYVRRWLDVDEGYLDWVWAEYRKFIGYVIFLEAFPDMPRQG